MRRERLKDKSMNLRNCKRRPIENHEDFGIFKEKNQVLSLDGSRFTRHDDDAFENDFLQKIRRITIFPLRSFELNVAQEILRADKISIFQIALLFH